MILWCNGLKFCSKGSKHPRANEESDSDAEQCSKKAKKKKQRKESETEERVKEAIEELKQCHTKSGYTAMQFIIWAEMFVGGVHPSLNEPPKSTMFIRAGGGSAPKRRDSFADAVSQIAVALSPKVASTRGDGTSGSPAKLIENCTKCYKQLSELNNLKLLGLLTEEEYDVERQAIMGVLKKLN